MPFVLFAIAGPFHAAVPLQIDTPALSIGVFGVSYPTYPLLQASGGSGTGYSFIWSLGAVPGMTLLNNGGFSGTPTTAGGFPITIQVTDSLAATATRAYTFVVQANATYTPPDNWDARGIFGGTIKQIAVSPDYANDATLFVAGNLGEIFRSTNQGATWGRQLINPVRLDAGVVSLRLSPVYSQLSTATPEAQTIFIASREIGVWKSVDHGQSFASANSGLPCAGAAACPDGQPNIVGLALSPGYGAGADRTLFALTSYSVTNSFSQLYRSDDGAVSWTLVGAVDNYSKNYPFAYLESSPNFALDHTLIAGGPSAPTERSVNSGAPGSWAPFGVPSYIRRVTFSPDYATDLTIFFDKARTTDGGTTIQFLSINTGWMTAVKRIGLPPLWYAVNDYSGYGVYLGNYDLYRSDDAFRTWTKLFSRGMPPGIYSGASITATLLAATPVTAAGFSQLIFASPQGVAMSFDEGFSFTGRSNFLTSMQFPSISGAATSVAEVGPGGWILNIGNKQWIRRNVGADYSFAMMSPNFESDKTIYLIQSDGLVVRSTDGGASFINVYSGSNIAQTSYAFAPGFTPATGTLYYGQTTNAGNTSAGLHKAVNGGGTPGNWSTVAYTDSLNAGRCTISGYTGIYGIAISPNYATDQTIYLALGGDDGVGVNKGLCRSPDAGATWQPVAVQGAALYGALALAPGFNQNGPSGPNRAILLSATDGKIYFSNDGGATWTIPAGQPAQGLFGLPAFSPHFVTDLTAFIASGSVGGMRIAGAAAGLWRTQDGGASFSPLLGGDLLGTRVLTGLYLPAAFDAGNAGGPGALAATDGSGLWKSGYNGGNFSAVSNYKSVGDNLSAAATAFTGTVYAGTQDLGAFTSTDGGNVFSALNAGLPPGANVISLFVPALQPSPLAGLKNGGLWKYNGSQWTQFTAAPLSTTGNYSSFRQDGAYVYAARSDGPSVRSADSGNSWSAVNSAELDLNALDYNSQLTPTFQGDPLVKKSGPSPNLAAAVTAGLWGVSFAGGPRYSSDSGVTWIAAPGVNDYTLPAQSWSVIRALGINAASGSREVLAGSATGLFRSTDGGATWRNVNGAGSGLEATSKNFSALLSTVTRYGTTDLLAGATGAVNGGVYLSGDGGEHWTQINQGFDPNNLSISSLVTTSCSGCPVQYYSGSYGGGMFTRTVTVSAPPLFPVANYSCFGDTACTCATGGGTGPEQGGQAFKLCGSNFQTGAVIEFDGVPVYTNYGGGGCTLTASQIVCNAGASGTPAHAPGLASIRVRNPDTRIGYLPVQYTYTAGTSRAGNLHIAKSGSDAALTWSCAACIAANPARINRSQNAAFSLYVENYNGGIAGVFTNTGAIASAQSYFWSVE